MENQKQVGSSSPPSSFTAELFGTKESLSPPSSAGIFASIFPPPATVLGRKSISSQFKGHAQNQFTGWSTKQGTPDNVARSSEGASNSSFNKERSSIFQERVEPCPLSSSLYYGGQEDMYVRSSSDQTSQSCSIFKKDGGEEDPDGNQLHGASRGNWWQEPLFFPLVAFYPGCYWDPFDASVDALVGVVTLYAEFFSLSMILFLSDRFCHHAYRSHWL
ncbi:hypothetical protein RJ639_022702 [Escallonia herrerae]|uniref:Uncharacterized protein n=1 Tax=Escallonia herrerae TaxID=1293975 RepID=A0AA88V027_9ASTE|nr:hypothetical protein RJ639_022702 [Escallonia herrerae]